MIDDEFTKVSQKSICYKKKVHTFISFSTLNYWSSKDYKIGDKQSGNITVKINCSTCSAYIYKLVHLVLKAWIIYLFCILCNV